MGIQLRQHGNFAATFTVVVALGFSSGAHADITISTDSTQNMNCSGGVCQPTATTAVLNVNDLEGYLASGNVEVTTSGSGGVQANNIDIEAALTWSTANALSLVAKQSVEIDQPVSITGAGGLSLTNGGTLQALAFGSSGNVTFASLSSSLTINGAAYTLENDVKGLASAIASHPNGDFALAASFGARKEGIYRGSPVPTVFGGTFEGLGNTISELVMHNVRKPQFGMFSELSASGTIRDVALSDETAKSYRSHGGKRRRLSQDIGGLVGDNYGTVFRSLSGGTISTISQDPTNIGGLVGSNEQGATILQSTSSASMSAGSGGGLVGNNYGTITQSYATGAITAPQAGGLVGGTGNSSIITQSYATGSVTANNYGGGFIGINDSGMVSQAYSTGAVSAGIDAGGLVGRDNATNTFSNCYWDLDTSGISNPSQGAGYPPNDPGITGLTTAQFQSGLPSGFDPTVWAENSSINNGFPYLINNPPPQ